MDVVQTSCYVSRGNSWSQGANCNHRQTVWGMKLRYIVFVPYLIFIGITGGNVLVDALVIGLALAMYDFLFDGGGGGRPA